MAHNIPLDESNRADVPQEDGTSEVTNDVAYKRLMIVNVVFYGLPDAGDRNWVLIDTGVPGMTGRIAGGLFSILSPLFPKGPINVSSRLRTLPADGTVPGMPGWTWLHTPGHSAGHVSFWREADRTLIAGDAVITTSQESVYAVATQRTELHGPPMYFTPDWEKAKSSVERLAALEPEIVVSGHGRAMQGPEMRQALQQLAREFDTIAVPESGKYVGAPARAEDGSAYKDPEK